MLANFCKVKIIRNFLSLYKENCWEKLICNMAEYGIILLKKKKNISSMSSEDIINFVEDVKRTEGLLSPMNNILNHKRNTHSKNKNSNTSLFNNSFNKSITSNYSTKSSKSSNKQKRGFSVKAKSKSKQKFLKRNISFSLNKNDKTKTKSSNKSFSDFDKRNSKNNNYMRIKIESNREFKNDNIKNINKNEILEGQTLKESFASLSSKDAFIPNKKKNSNNFISTHKSNNSNNKKQNISKKTQKNANIYNNEIYNNTTTNNNMNNNNIKKKKKKKGAGTKSKTVKVESKIKDLIKKDKNNFINTGGINSNNFKDPNNNQVYALPINAMDELGSLRSNNDIPTKTSSDSLRLNIMGNKNNNFNTNNINNNLTNNEINNININNNFISNNNNNISTITSLEDKLNGLTLKLSKLNESINNNKKKLSAYSNMDQFNMYNNNINLKEGINEKENNSPFINIGLGNTVLGNLDNINEVENNDMKLNNGINKNMGLKHINFNNNNLEENKIINNNLNNENDEDYLGEEQLNI